MTQLYRPHARVLPLALLGGMALASCHGNAPSAQSPVDGETYVGVYFDEDCAEPSLYISRREADGLYDVELGIYRLTLLDDGVGTLSDDGLHFTATDASGNPIGALITLRGDTAVVRFTDSQWELLPTGSEFRYTRQ